MDYINSIYQAVLEGNAKNAKDGVEAALQAGLPVSQIMQEGLIAAMSEVGRLYEEGECFVPEMLIAARAMQAGLEPLRPLLAEGGVKSSGRVVIGTVKGDLHDIGKNLVGMMLEGAGFEIIDLGTDVTPAKFVDAVIECQPHLVAMSALLTTTMLSMDNTIRALNDAGVRGKVRVMVGGAPVTQDFADRIGADGFAQDASSAARLARTLIEA